MATQWLRRALLLAAGASALLLAACGGGSVASQFNPGRLVAFGDAMADLGQNGAQYTINGDGTVSNWTTFVANAYGRPLAASAAGGTSYATGNARVTATPDAAGNSATPTVTQQVDAFLAAGAPTPQDMILVNGGTSDIIVHGKAVIDGSETQDAALAAVQQAGIALGAQVRRLVDAGATHVVVVGPYNLGRSLWVRGGPQESMVEALSSRFNQQMLVSIVDLGDKVLYVDAALYFNLVTSAAASYDVTDAVDSACTSVDPGPGIGIGNGQVNSNLCTTSTLAAGIDRTRYLFADRVYPTPRGHQLFGDYALGRIRDRW